MPMKKKLSLLIIVIAITAPLAAFATSNGQYPKVVLSPKKVGPGDIMLVTVKNADGPVEGTFNKKKLFFNPAKKGSEAIVGIDLLTEPGEYDLDVTVNGAAIHRTVTVSKKKYPLQRLTLPKDMVELSPENEARVEREQARVAALWPKQSDRLWSGDFVNPRPGKISSIFGMKRIINHIPKSPHTGVDVAAREGDPVVAPNDAVVVMVDVLFFTGNTVILDHGQGIYSMFFHLSKVLVEPGKAVKKGDVIGLVGATGRATGPHLHWGVRVEGARVDPLELINLELE